MYFLNLKVAAMRRMRWWENLTFYLPHQNPLLETAIKGHIKKIFDFLSNISAHKMQQKKPNWLLDWCYMPYQQYFDVQKQTNQGTSKD